MGVHYGAGITHGRVIGGVIAGDLPESNQQRKHPVSKAPPAHPEIHDAPYIFAEGSASLPIQAFKSRAFIYQLADCSLHA